MMPIRTNQNTSQRYRKRIRDRAKAARLAVTTVPSALNVDVMMLAAYQLMMSPWSSSVRYEASVGSMIFHVGFVVSPLGLREVSTAQAKGTSQSNANAMSTPMQVRLNNFSRRSAEVA
jgi:hypothetical protein